MGRHIGGALIRGICECGNLNAIKGKDPEGRRRYESRCHQCKRYGRRLKDTHCHHCGFIPVDKVQLDVDHIDGNPSNNDPSNIQTLCANCHRLKTKLKQDWIPKK